MNDRPSCPLSRVLDPGPGKAWNKLALVRCFLLCAVEPLDRVELEARLGGFHPALPCSAGVWLWGSGEGQARHSGGHTASCSRIQSNYMALQRINQELEDKLYRMVRATTRYPVAPPGTPTPRPPTLKPWWEAIGLLLPCSCGVLTPGTGPVPP